MHGNLQYYPEALTLPIPLHLLRYLSPRQLFNLPEAPNLTLVKPCVVLLPRERILYGDTLDGVEAGFVYSG